MKKQLTTIGLLIAGFAFGIGFNNAAMSDLIANNKIAIVDVNKVVAQSAQVKALKKEQQTKTQELQKWLDTVKADINRQSTQAGKEKLTKKYDEEFAKRQELIRKNYTTKLKAIDASITSVIAQQARANNYSVVLSKSVVLYGGDDITESVAKLVK